MANQAVNQVVAGNSEADKPWQKAVLRELGFRQFRVRLHDKLARVEIAPDEIARAFSSPISSQIVKKLKSLGFSYVALDLEGYRQGSLNETLAQRKPS